MLIKLYNKIEAAQIVNYIVPSPSLYLCSPAGIPNDGIPIVHIVTVANLNQLIGLGAIFLWVITLRGTK